MEFRIADTFQASLAKLTGKEQKAVKTTAFDLQLDPSGSGKQFHRVDKARDPNFWSLRAGRDIRLIVHKTGSSILLCYVDHHDKAYKWAERRKLENHPKTGAAQLVEIRETVTEIPVPRAVKQSSGQKTLFTEADTDRLLRFGVPQEWLNDVLAADEDSILEIVEHLPSEAAEAVLNLAIGHELALPPLASKSVKPFDHPDALRRFRAMDSIEELERALNYPWEKWTVFLHPSQKAIAEGDFNGPARVSGSAGTGKTVVALHRAAYLARTNPDDRILLTTFSDTLSKALQTKLFQLISNEPRLGDRIEVLSLGEIAKRLYKGRIGAFKLASKEAISEFMKEAAEETEGHKYTPNFLMTEWTHVVCDRSCQVTPLRSANVTPSGEGQFGLWQARGIAKTLLS